MILLLSDVYSRKKAYFPQNSDRFRKMLFNPFLRAEPNDFSFPSFQRAGSARTVKKKKGNWSVMRSLRPLIIIRRVNLFINNIQATCKTEKIFSLLIMFFYNIHLGNLHIKRFFALSFKKIRHAFAIIISLNKKSLLPNSRPSKVNVDLDSTIF